MRVLDVLTLAVAMIPYSYAACDNVHGVDNGLQGWGCEWYSCKTTDAWIGDKDGDLTLAAWTKWNSAENAYKAGEISKQCYDDYGWGCITGYKRLWCKTVRTTYY
ncbi:hypothetical protein GQ53DRAFT_50745 [Thozetella sp. PMI_491]|nr:hypothetical protein GQ53DRAFT_50745 [Thozetella sp. PMI_491]